jgi:activator of HSP90 ATPase
MINETTSAPNTRDSASTRRQMIALSAIGLGVAAVVVTRAVAQQAVITSAKKNAIVVARAIHQEQDFNCGAQRIYESLLDAERFSAFSGGRAAEIHREAGGAFSLFGGHIVGRNLELVANRRIVQAWRAVGWPDGIYSIARFELLEQGAGARVILDHTGFPPELAEHLESGWNENYWTALRKYLG